jgi:hypothetical protein
MSSCGAGWRGLLGDRLIASQRKESCDRATVQKAGTANQVLAGGKQELLAPFSVGAHSNAHQAGIRGIQPHHA